ncbi:MAG TPA: RDD family protein [Burkholderiales bacterium]|nr:RDD family protein [Burkholderiales bacterium]
MSALPSEAPQMPSVLRRLASMLYESMLLVAIAVIASAVFLLANGGQAATGWVRHAEQAYLAAVFGAYFVYCWLRGGQTLAMKAWRIRLVAPGQAQVPVRLVVLRLVYAAIFLGAFGAAVVGAFVHRDPWLAFASLALTGIGLGWALFDRDRQFLHDRLAGTQLVLVPRGR